MEVVVEKPALKSSSLEDFDPIVVYEEGARRVHVYLVPRGLFDILARKQEQGLRFLREDDPSSDAHQLNMRLLTDAFEELLAIKATEQVGAPSVVIPNVEQATIDEMAKKAVEVLGSRDEGMRWLGTPVRGLDFATPISLLATEEGARRVSDVLGQMEHGVW